MKLIYSILLLFSLVSTATANDQTVVFGYFTNKVFGNDMSPALKKGEFVVSDSDFYKNNNLSRGDIIIFESPKNDGKVWVKRIIGMPKEQLEISDGIIKINGKPLEENYVLKENNKGVSSILDKKLEIPPNHIFVLGDNRDISNDSRFFGSISIDKVKAKVVAIYWSNKLSRIGKLQKIEYH